MISFDLTEEQRELQALAHEYAERELRPAAAAANNEDTDRTASAIFDMRQRVAR